MQIFPVADARHQLDAQQVREGEHHPVVGHMLAAPDLLTALQAIDDGAGLERPYRNAPRTLDLDLLLYGSARVDSPTLTVPHPRRWERAFVLVPLRETAPSQVADARMSAVRQSCAFDAGGPAPRAGGHSCLPHVRRGGAKNVRWPVWRCAPRPALRCRCAGPAYVL
jgi:hypothetical protein